LFSNDDDEEGGWFTPHAPELSKKMNMPIPKHLFELPLHTTEGRLGAALGNLKALGKNL
jgi:hypothetical protein